MERTEAIIIRKAEEVELERIILDRDEPAALDFLRSVVWAQVRTIRRKRLDPRRGTSPGIR